MVKLKVLQLTDAKGYEQSYYSAQLEVLLGDKHITDTYYILTDNNIVVDIDKSIDRKDINVKKAFEAGAEIKNIFYVDDSNFSEHIQSFKPKGFWDFVEYAEEEGVIFAKEADAKKYEKHIDKIKVRDEFIEEIKDIEAIEKIFFCKKIGKVVATEFTQYLSTDGDNIREISETKLNKAYKTGRICPLGWGYLISENEWQWLEENEDGNFDTIFITAKSVDDKLKELCDYHINEYDVGGNSEREIYIKKIQ